MGMERRTRGIIWDLDGTLADTLRDIADAGNAALASAGLPHRELREYTRFVGDGVTVLIRRASGTQDPDAVQAMETIFRKHYERHGLDHTQLFPGIAPLLDRLIRADRPMCVLSNKPHAYTLQTVDALCAPWPFVKVLGQREGTPRKPDPAAALHLAARMKCSPADIAFIGDSEVDMHTARNADMFAIGVNWGFREHDEIEKAGADAIIDRPEELLPLIGIDP